MSTTRLRAMSLVCILLLPVGEMLAQEDGNAVDEDRVLEVDAADAPPSAEPACFNVRAVRDFSGLSNQYIYVEEAGDNHFLLTMELGCFGLRNAIGIAISNRMSRVCSNDFARVTYRDFGRLQQCRILEVEKVQSKEAAKELVELRSARD